MYPLGRFLIELAIWRRGPPIGLTDPHVSRHTCWPWDLDPWIELNNGRTLTLFDLGRIPMAARTGLVGLLRRNGWGFTVAGNSVRYRRRIRGFQRFTMVSRTIGWDDRFIYMEQSMWRKGECCNHMLLRTAITGRSGGGGIVPPAQLLESAGLPTASPPLPDWVRAWIAADTQRPWPPVLPGLAKRQLPD